MRSLRQEYEIQKCLQHPNIIQLIESFETEHEYVLVSEFAQKDLHSVLSREGSIGEVRSQKLCHDLVSALYYLHSHRILHRDLKPQNILLDSTEKAKLCDFGLARNMTLGTHVLTSIKVRKLKQNLFQFLFFSFFFKGNSFVYGTRTIS